MICRHYQFDDLTYNDSLLTVIQQNDYRFRVVAMSVLQILKQNINKTSYCFLRSVRVDSHGYHVDIICYRELEGTKLG